MKKTIYSTFLLIALCITIYSCVSEDSDLTMSTNTNNIHNNNLKNLTSNPLLFTYSSKNECINKTRATMSSLAIENRNSITSSRQYNKIVELTAFSNNKAIIKERHYIDSARNLIINSQIFNPSTGRFDVVNVNTPLSGGPVTSLPLQGLLQGNCPDGFLFIDSCDYNSDNYAYGDCIGSQIGGFQSSYFEYSLNLIVTVNGASGTSICGAFNM